MKNSSELTKAPIFVLHVDDDSAFLKITKKILEALEAFHVDTAFSADEALDKMKKTTYDVVVSDYQMSGKDGLEFLRELRAEGNDVPFILFTGKGRESIAIQALNLGADGYFNKLGESETVYGELAHGIRQTVERNRSKEALVESEERYRHLFESSREGIAFSGPEGKITKMNDAFVAMLGYDNPEELVGVPAVELALDPKTHRKTLFKDISEKDYTKRFELTLKKKDGSPIHVLCSGLIRSDENGNLLQTEVFLTDITEHKKAENSLRNRFQFESIVSKISANLINAPTSELDKTVSEALKIICQFVDAERCSIFLFSDNCTKLTNTHEWCSNPKDSLISLLQGLPVEVFGYYFNILKKLKMVVINRLDDLPNEAKNERKWSEEHGFRPLVFVPMIHKGALYGTVGYYGKVDKEQVWSKDAIEYLNILSDIFVNAMEHKRFEEEIKGLARFPSENPNPVLRITKDGTILYANASSKSLLQEWRSEVNGFVPDEWSRHVSNVFHSGESQEIEIEYDERVHSFVLTPVVDGSYVNAYSRDITERKKIEEALRESEERFRTISTSANDAIVLMDDEGIISYWNPAAENMFGYTKKEAIGQDMYKFLSPKRFHEDYKRGFANFKETGLGAAVGKTVELAAIRRDGTEFPIELSLSAFNLKGKWHATGIIRDVTESKTREEEMKRRLMRFRLDDGNLYLVKESSPALSIEAFKDLINVGYHGLVISRTPESEFKKNVDGSFDFRWLAESGGEKSLTPKFNEIENSLEKMLKKSVVLLDCLDYLVLKNGFKETLSFVQHLREIVYLKGNVVILSIDATTISAREVMLLGKEAMEVESRVFVRLPEDLLEILRFIYEHNALGSKPNYTDVRQELSISKPTVGKRIKNLVNTGYVTVNPRGRSKVLELTYKGMRIFLK